MRKLLTLFGLLLLFLIIPIQTTYSQSTTSITKYRNNKTYKVNDLVSLNGVVYKCTTQTNTTPPDSNWTLIPSAEVAFTPYGTITSTDLQLALQELKDEVDALSIGGGTGDMLKATYDGNTNNIVDNSEALENQAGAYYLNRANHTGTQLANTISDINDAITSNAQVLANTAKIGITPQQAADIVTNNAKVGITAQQAADIVTNNAKINNIVAGTNITLDATDPLNPVISSTGAGVLNTDYLPEGTTNLYYTEARVSANASVAANTAKVSNITHTGDVTDAGGVLTIGNTGVTDGTYNNANVTVGTDGRITFIEAGTTGSTTLGGLTDVEDATRLTNEVLYYSGTQWENIDPSLLVLAADPYGIAWATSNYPARQKDVYDKIETLGTGITNLGYTASSTDGTVTSDTGTDATLPLADDTNAGLLAPADFTKLSAQSGTNTGDQDLSSYATKGQDVLTYSTAGQYSTSGRSADDGKKVYLESGVTGINLDDTGISVYWNQLIYNDTGGDISFTIIGTPDNTQPEQTLVDIPDTGYAYIELRALNTWSTSVGNRPSDLVYSVSWDGDISSASKNAIYDKIESMGAGSGDVVGPASAVDNNLASFNTTTGKLIKDSGVSSSNVALKDAANEFTNATNTFTSGNLYIGNTSNAGSLWLSATGVGNYGEIRSGATDPFAFYDYNATLIATLKATPSADTDLVDVGYYNANLPAGSTVATVSDVNAGTDNTKFISPLALAGSTLQSDVLALTELSARLTGNTLTTSPTSQIVALSSYAGDIYVTPEWNAVYEYQTGTAANQRTFAKLAITTTGQSVFPYVTNNINTTAGAFIVGRSYTIVSVGTTSFTSIGAASNTVGVRFVATGVGTGTGTASLDAVLRPGAPFVASQIFDMVIAVDYITSTTINDVYYYFLARQ